MKPFTLTKIFLISLLSAQVFAQSWTALNTGTTTNLWGVSFVDQHNGWVCGASGLVMKTTDGGVNWSTQNSGQTTPILRNIEMLNLTTGWMVGDNGIILATTDGGSTWTAQTSGSSQTLRQSSFISPTVGWICGGSGTILHTNDGGLTWIVQNSGTTVGLMSICFADANNGWAVGSSGGTNQNVILHTTNGGANWTAQSAPNVNNLNAMTLVNSNAAWAGGSTGTIFNTANAGSNWGAQSSNLSTNIRCIDFVDANNGWAADDAGGIIHTSDGGSNWTAQNSGSTQFFRAIHFVNLNRGYVVGASGTALIYNLPVLNNAANFNSFSTLLGTPTAAQSFTLDASYIASALTVTAPAEFEVSLSSGSGFGPSVSILPSSFNIASTTVYVRYNPSAVGTHNGSLVLANGSVNQSIALSGTCVSANSPNITNGNVGSPFTTFVGSPSAPQSISVSGSNLTANIDITAPADFEVSILAGSGFGPSISITPTAGIVPATTVYIRYNPSAAGNHSGNVSLSSAGAITQQVSVSGSSTVNGIQDLNESDGLLIYPNPAQNTLNIQMIDVQEGGELKLFSMEGKLLVSSKLEQMQTSLDLSAFPDGTYGLQLKNGERMLTRRINVLK